MVHSIELLLDTDSEAAVRQMWDGAFYAGLPAAAPSPTSRPHATLVVADRISPDVDEALKPVLQHLPLPCVIGAAMVFGRSPFVLVRAVVPSAELLDLQAEVARSALPYITPVRLRIPRSGNGRRMSRLRVG